MSKQEQLLIELEGILNAVEAGHFDGPLDRAVGDAIQLVSDLANSSGSKADSLLHRAHDVAVRLNRF